MNFNELVDIVSNDIVKTLPKYCFDQYKYKVIEHTEGPYVEHVKAIINSRNTDKTKLVEQANYASPKHELLTEYNYSILTGQWIEVVKQYKYVPLPVTEMLMIDKFPILPTGTYQVEIATVEPKKLIDMIASLMFYLERGDVSTSYQIINNISVETYNSIAENKFETISTNNDRKVKVKPCLM